jgi:hypothetical protein
MAEQKVTAGWIIEGRRSLVSRCSARRREIGVTSATRSCGARAAERQGVDPHAVGANLEGHRSELEALIRSESR